MNKDKILEWIDNSIKSLKDEQGYNENSHKEGTFSNWQSKDEGSFSAVMDNWWGYQVLIWQLENIKKQIDDGEFNE